MFRIGSYQTLAPSLAAIRALLYGAGALGGLGGGVLGGQDPALPLLLGVLGTLALYPFALGPLHPRRLGELEAQAKG